MGKCPLTGQMCPHKKCIHVTEIENYQATEEKHLCTFCGVPYLAENGGPEFNAGAYEIFEVLNNIIKGPNVTGGTVMVQPKMVVPGCPNCGHTIEDILTIGKLGCGHCYEFYKKELLPLIEKCQSSANKHVGKSPKFHSIGEKLKKAFTKEPEIPKEAMIKKLETQLQEAVDAENYAEAAKLRDKIKQLKSE